MCCEMPLFLIHQQFPCLLCYIRESSQYDKWGEDVGERELLMLSKGCYLFKSKASISLERFTYVRLSSDLLTVRLLLIDDHIGENLVFMLKHKSLSS